ncbi:Ig-like domain-containing protein [Agromyces sp. SYSU T00194]|uniref:Ig-like domain-containing protein n=1 Tax=Agromyces chitinivorans TaxID=3158560 RepID=UPI003398ECF5
MHVEGHRTAADVAASVGVRGGGPRATVHGRRMPLRRRIALAASALALAAASALVAAPASAAPGDPPGLTPAIDAPADGSLVLDRTVTVTGTRPAGAQVTISNPSGGGPLCVVPAEPSTAWSCRVTLPDGPSVPIRASTDTAAGTASDEITVAVLGPPFVRVPSGATDGTVTGLAYPGAEVHVSDQTGGSCAATAGTSREWSCVLAGGSGAERQVRATQSTGFSAPRHSAASAPIAYRVDQSAPAAPFVGSPRDGTRLATGATTARGVGEPGAEVTLYEGGAQLCSTTVAGDGSWACAIRSLGDGSHVLTVLQSDAVGNISRPSALTLLVGDGAVAEEVGTGATDDPAADADGGTRATDGASSTDPTASPTPQIVVAAPFVDDGAPAAASDWSRATGLTTALPSAAATSALPWLGALLAAVVAILVVALPARLVPAGPGAARTAAHVAGRHHPADDYDHTPSVPVGRSAAIAACVVGAALLSLITTPVAGLATALRTLLAITIGLAIVNLVASVVPALVMRRVPPARARPVAAPWGLVLVAVASFLARVVGLEAIVLFGVVTGVRFDGHSPASVRGLVAVLRIAGLLALSGLAWIGVAALPSGTGATLTLATEVLTVVTLSGATSAAALLVPLPHSAGRAVMDRSPLAWGLLALVTGVLVALLLSMRYAESALPVIAPAIAAGLGVVTAVAAGVRLRRWVAERREAAPR